MAYYWTLRFLCQGYDNISIMKRTCLVCGGDGFEKKYGNVSDYEYGTYHPVDFVVCNYCGLVVQSPLPKTGDIPSFYPAEYRNHLNFSNGFFYSKLKKFQLWWFASKLERFLPDKTISKNAKILEIGCGSGALLIALKEKGYERLWGSDLLNASAKQLSGKNIMFKKGDIVEKFPFKEKFDMIILNHVFEHLLDPKSVLQKCHDHLSKNGKIIIVMPNSDSLVSAIFKEKWDGLNAPRHLFIFSPRTMEILKKKLGFNRLTFYPMPDPLNWSISFQNFLQSQPIFQTKLKNGLAWYTIPFGLLFTPVAVLSTIGKKSAGMLYLYE